MRSAPVAQIKILPKDKRQRTSTELFIVWPKEKISFGACSGLVANHSGVPFRQIQYNCGTILPKP